MNSKSLLLRSDSGRIPVHVVPGSSTTRSSVSLTVHGAAGEIGGASSPRMSLHMGIPRRNIRRSCSAPNLVRSEMRSLGSRSLSTLRIPEDGSRFGGDCAEVPGGGMNKRGNSSGGGNGGGGGGEERRMGGYYEEMIKSDSTNSLLLRNYAKYLHEVEGDAVKAEEYYGRAILESPGDGELLSLYGRLIWETQRDESRAKSYLTQALQASPHDCMVLGSYASFLWEAEENGDGEEEMEMGSNEVQMPIAVAAMMEAF